MASPLRRVFWLLGAAACVFAFFVWTSGLGWYGDVLHAGVPRALPLPGSIVGAREARIATAAEAVGIEEPKQILFGDLHVHSSFSLDAFQLTMPIAGGEGTHPVADACDFARHCARLDFWSINDHANSLTPRKWRETVEAMQQCDALARSAERLDLVSFLGWEWTQMGSNPANHFGHKNVILRDLDDASIPTRPIAAAPPAGVPNAFSTGRGGALLLGTAALFLERGQSLATFMAELSDREPCPLGVPVRELPPDCFEEVRTPGELFAKLDEWDVPSLVIPHGTAWGMYTPPGSGWAKQLTTENHDPMRQRLIEVYSGHGNSEEARPWSAVEIDRDGTRRCPEPRPEYLPACWRAGEIIGERCAEAGGAAAECADRAAEARQAFVDANRNAGPWTVPGAEPDDWLDAGQCRDCFQPAFNYRPRSSVQSILALVNRESPGAGDRFRFGFIASSDGHTARPGTGYKEVLRREFTDARMGEIGRSALVDAYARPAAVEAERFDDTEAVPSVAFFEAERAGSFFLTGGLAAVHAEGRSRTAIWDALERRETYGTSGPRILLWFDLVNGGATGDEVRPMGSDVAMSTTPEFRVRAVGSFEQLSGCPRDAANLLSEDDLQRLCRGECDHPSDVRRPITRIEVVRIRPGAEGGGIEDPWTVIPCDEKPEGCVVTFEDPEFTRENREVLYYVRAIEAASPTIDADPLGCTRDAAGRCTSLDPCFERPDDDDCRSPSEHRAWASPIRLTPATRD